jgi:hypothetical protein
MIPAGAELVSGGVTYSNPTGSRIDLSWSLWKGSADSGAGTLVDTLAIDLANPGVLTNLPLGSDAYNVQAAHITAIVPSSTDYTFTFDVKPEAAAVPEPRAVSALAMFGLGLAAFARRQLRAQAKAA